MVHSKIEMLSPELQVSDLDRSIDFYLGNTTEIILAWPTVVFDNKP